MNNSNKTTHRYIRSEPEEPFQNQDHLGLFTFYKMQEKQDSSLLPLLQSQRSPPKTTLQPVFKTIDKKKSKTEGKKGSIQEPILQKERREMEDFRKEWPNKKTSELFHLRMQNLAEMNFQDKRTRKNAFKYQNYPNLRLKTDPQTPHCNHTPNIEELPQSVRLLNLSEVTGEEVKHLFKSKRKAISRYLNPSLSGAQLKQSLQDMRGQRNRRGKMKMLQVEGEVEDGKKMKELNKSRSVRQDNLGILNYLYQQKKLFSSKYLQTRQKKRIEESLISTKIQRQVFRKIRINDSPLLTPIHLSHGDVTLQNESRVQIDPQ